MNFLRLVAYFALVFPLLSGNSLGSKNTIKDSVKLNSEADWNKYEDVPWEFVKEKNGFKTYQYSSPTTDVFAFKAIGTIKQSIGKIANVIIKIERYREWGPNVKKAKTIKQMTPYDRIDYIHLGTPFIIKDRDFVLRGKADLSQAPKFLNLWIQSVKYANAPKTDYVRAKMYAGHFKLTPVNDGKHTKIVYLAHVDPMGSVPKWVIYGFQRRYPNWLMAAISKQAARTDVVAHPEIKRLYVTHPKERSQPSKVSKAKP